MKYLLIIALIIQLVACDSKTSSTNQVSDNSVSKKDNKLFGEFLDSLPRHNLPINLVCGLPDYTGADKFKKFKEFIPIQYDAVYGLIGQMKNFKCIMFGQVGDDIYPTLFTFDNNGKVLDSLSLILSPCGAADEFLIPSAFASLNSDLRIKLSDTLKYIHYPTSSSEYVLDSIKTSEVIYAISQDGRMIKQ